MTAGPSIAELSRRFADHAEDLTLELLGQPTSRTRTELRYRSRGSLCVNVGGPKRGRFIDFEAGQGGDLIDLIKAVQGVDTREAVRWAKAWFGIERARPGAREPRAKQGDAIKRRKPRPQPGANTRGHAARDIWRGARAAHGTPIETYLCGRGITIAIPPSIRYAPALKHGPTGTTFPAMVAAVTRCPDRRVVAIQRTFLKPDAQGKANVSQPRMALGPVAGGSVRLAPAGPRLGLAEGIEDGLAVMQAEPGLRMWACLGTSGLRSVILPPPPLAAEVVILADGDEAGEAAAQDAARRFIAEGRRVSIARPPLGCDFNYLATA